MPSYAGRPHRPFRHNPSPAYLARLAEVRERERPIVFGENLSEAVP